MRFLRSIFLISFSSGCLFWTLGCQCTSWTDHYSDTIDEIADRSLCLDECYSPCWDLTRIGHSDWQECRLQRALCETCSHEVCELQCPNCQPHFSETYEEEY